MGDRSQIYIKYGDRIWMNHVKYLYGDEMLSTLIATSEIMIDKLKGGDKIPSKMPLWMGEDMLYSHFYYVEHGRKDLQDTEYLWNYCNQCGKMFIEVCDDFSVKYCFTDTEDSFPVGKQNAMDWKELIEWDKKDIFISFEDVWKNAPVYGKKIDEKLILMSQEELEAFIMYPYDYVGMYAEFIKRERMEG